MTTMKEMMQQQADKLIALMAEEVIDVKDFYNISFTPTSIRLQGDAKSNTIDKFKDQGFKFSLDESCIMMLGDKDNIYVVLTF